VGDAARSEPACANAGSERGAYADVAERKAMGQAVVRARGNHLTSRVACARLDSLAYVVYRIGINSVYCGNVASSQASASVQWE
jgi:hypothetical protein